jgi:hypothetical protein
MKKLWSWATDAHYVVQEHRTMLRIPMPVGYDLKHITFHKCPATHQLILNAEIKNLAPSYSKDGSSSTEADGGYEGVGADGGTVKYCGPSGSDNGGTLR